MTGRPPIVAEHENNDDSDRNYSDHDNDDDNDEDKAEQLSSLDQI